jgi:glutathione S-transferase
MEKTMWALYERRFKPEEKVHQPWIDRNDDRVLAGLRFLDEVASQTDEDGWLAGGTRMSQADITAAVAYTFANASRPHLNLAEQVPNLARFAARCEELPFFKKVPLPEATA